MATRPVSVSIEDEVDLLLNRYRDALLDLARSRRNGGRSYPTLTGGKRICLSPLEMPQPDPLTDLIGAAQYEHAKVYAGEIARLIEDLVLSIDDIPDRRRRLGAFENISMLIGCVHDETLKCAIQSPAEYTRVWIQMSRARSPNAQRVEQRRERLWPLVLETVNKFPSASPAKIATLLRQQKGFKAQFEVTRRTLETDVAVLLATSETE
jgi:hypothetical protein